MHLLRLLVATAVAGLVRGGWINPGTPAGIPASFDCAARQVAYEFGMKTLPSRGSFRSLFDALQLQNCNMTAPATMDAWTPPTYPTPKTGAVYVDAGKGKDTNPGTVDAPVATLHRGIAVARKMTPATVLLREGTYYLSSTVILEPADAGLTIQNYNGEHAVVSGGIPFSVDFGEWAIYESVPKSEWLVSNNSNNVYGAAIAGGDGPNIVYAGTFSTLAECEAGLAAVNDLKGPFYSFTFHTPEFGGSFAGQCFGITTDYWKPVAEDKIISGRRIIEIASYKAQIAVPGLDLEGVPGLRLDGRRMTRAKYPNGNPEESGNWFASTDPAMGRGVYYKGWNEAPTTWIPPRPAPAPDTIIITGVDWPGVEWPMTENTTTPNKWTGEGDWGEFHLGVGGTCAAGVTPPVGYWCSDTAPRGITAHQAPSGVMTSGLPNSPYGHPEGAIINAWRGCNGRWYTNQFLVKSGNDTVLNFHPTIGGNQGGEGCQDASGYTVENVIEELDFPMEYLYNSSAGMLYYSVNGTARPTGNESWVATNLKVLFNATSTQANPIRNITIRGLEMVDTMYTYLDPVGLPSGGDWSLGRTGAIVLEGVEGATVDNCFMHNLDGTAIHLSGYNRHTSITSNEFLLLGDNAISMWGYTSTCLNANCSASTPYRVGPDARGGDQPRNTTIANNLAHELGIYQKQSSFLFHAVSGFSTVSSNVFFNGGRAALNFNDGAIGGDLIEYNLLANAVRESGDHGAWNSWDRVPYISNARTGSPSIIPRVRQLHHNMFMGLYNSQECMDTDDGSAFYEVSQNVFPYCVNGLKSDFGGRYNNHTSNNYGYVLNCYTGSPAEGYNNVFVNNTCILRDGGNYGSTCQAAPGMEVHGNAIYTQNGTLNTCGTTLEKWVAEGHDGGTSVSAWPSDAQWAAEAKALLGM